jgi:hypothetical protein
MHRKLGLRSLIHIFPSLFQTGWGTRAGIGDASAATAAMAAQDKRQQDEKVGNGGPIQNSNNPYQQRPYSTHNNSDSDSPFRDQQQPSYQDHPSALFSATPVYATRHTARKASLSQRRRPAENEVELEVGYAR